MSSGDKILSENYFQHADHFTRILSEQENFKRIKFSENNSDVNKKKENEKVNKFSEKENEDTNNIQTEAN